MFQLFVFLSQNDLERMQLNRSVLTIQRTFGVNLKITE